MHGHSMGRVRGHQLGSFPQSNLQIALPIDSLTYRPFRVTSAPCIHPLHEIPPSHSRSLLHVYSAALAANKIGSEPWLICEPGPFQVAPVIFSPVSLLSPQQRRLSFSNTVPSAQTIPKPKIRFSKDKATVCTPWIDTRPTMTSEQGSDGGATSSTTPESARLAQPSPSAYSSNDSTPVVDVTEACTSTAKSLEPPVTEKSLSELDASKIICNPKLRHDINFDVDLHFRPTLEGEKGRKKKNRSDQFWTVLEEQLTKFMVDRDNFHLKYGHGSDWCLPTLLKTVKGIIQTLVPQRDHAYLDDGFDVSLLMQQFNKGVADIGKLASWLSSFLKCHCAPMRDDNVDEMYNQLSYGNRNNDIGELVRE